MSSDQQIAWPHCLSVVAILKPTGWIGSMWTGAQCKVFSISGGNLQYSNHPKLAGIKANDAVEKLKDVTVSREWGLGADGVSKLDGFDFDPRDKGCTQHMQINGGLLGAKIEKHSDTEITVTTKMNASPTRIAFLSSDLCAAFVDLVERNGVCCQQKFNEQVGQAAQEQQQAQK